MGVYSSYYINSSSDQKNTGRCQVGWVTQRRYRHDVRNHMHDLANLTRRMKRFPDLFDVFHMAIWERAHGKNKLAKINVEDNRTNPLFMTFKTERDKTFY